MAAKINKKAVLAELQDLSQELQEIATSKKECFYEYRPKAEIGKKIYSALMEKYKADGGKFLFSADMPESGLISQLQGFASVIELYEGFGADAGTEKAKKFIDGMLDYILDTVKTDDGTYRISASPYLKGNDSIFDSYCYIDAVTWIISALLGVMRLHIAGDYIIDFSSARGKEIVRLYKFCLDYLIESYISNEDAPFRFNCGWNFTKDCRQPSLYFTFAVSELLIDMLNTFDNVIRVADISLIKKLIRETLDKENLFESDKYKKYADQIKMTLKAAAEDDSFEGYGEALKDFFAFTEEEKAIIYEISQKEAFVEQQYAEQSTRIEKGQEEVLREIALFGLINNNKEVYDDASPYRVLEEYCKKSANQIWELTKDNLSSEFYSADLESLISENAIESSVSSDAVFNTIFTVNILVNAGVDEDCEDIINYFSVNGSDEYKIAMTNYDFMRDTIRLAYDNCYQYFMKLKKEGKEYKINSYVLNFDESFELHDRRNIRDLRKEHIQVFTLMPLMVRTKTTIGEFLIQYPQYDMIIYLEHILKYRCWNSEAEEYIWVWENDGYSSSSNYYFISAFSDFYEYYQKYEAVFHSTIKGNEKAKQEIEKNHLKRLKEQGFAVDKTEDEFRNLQKEIEEKAQTIEALNKAIQAYESDPLRSALTGFIKDAVEKSIVDILTAKLSEEASKIVSSAKDRVMAKANDILEDSPSKQIELEMWDGVKGQVNPFEKAIKDIVLASMFSERLGETVYSAKKEEKEREDALDGINASSMKRIDEDLGMAVRYYLMPIANGDKSNFVGNRGVSTLSGEQSRELLKLLDERLKNKGEKK